MINPIRCKYCNQPADDYCGHCKAPTCSEHRCFCSSDGEMICPACDELEAELEEAFDYEIETPENNPILTEYALQSIQAELQKLLDRGIMK